MPASAIGTQFTVNEEVQNTQELAQLVVLPDGRVLATWMSFDADVDGSGAGISTRIGTVQANGTIVWGAAGEVTVNEEVQFDQLEPEVIVLPDGRLLFTWTSLDPDVDGNGRAIAARIGTPQADGSIVWGAAGEFTVNAQVESLQLEPRVTLLADGRVMFTWQSQDGDVDGSGAAISARIGTVQSDGSIVWATAGEFRVNEEVTNGQFGPQVIVLGDGRVLATWYSADADVDGNGNGISVRVGTVQTDGSIVWGAAGEVTVNEEVENGQGPVQVTILDDGRLLFTWGSSDADVDGNGAGIAGRVGSVQADGSITWATAGEFTVNATVTGDQSDPQITVLTDGRVLFLWTNGDPGVSSDISGRVGEIQADGSVVWDPAGEFTVNSQTTGAQRQVQVTELDDGRLLIVWTGANSDGNGAGIAGSVVVFNSAPIAQDDAFAVDENAVISGGDLFADNGSGADDSVDSDALAITEVNGSASDVGVQITLASGALLTVNANGTFTYDPNGAFTLGLDASDTDSFTYTVDDGFGGSDTATVTITINSVSETITGTADADTLSGGAGNDAISGLNGDDTLNGDAGDDTISGGAGLDALNGGDGNDTLNGGADADVLNGGAGVDAMTGGAGDDTYYVDSSSDTTSELLNEGTDLVISSLSFIGLNSNIENLTLVGSGPSNGFGNTLNNVITGSTGANSLSGGGGVDALYGGDGNDILYAWSGTNFSGNGALVDPTFLAGEIFDGGAGTDTLYMREDWTFDLTNVTLNSIEALWVMSSATVNIDAADLGAGLAANLTITSNTSDIRVNVILSSAGALSIAGWTLNAFNTQDQIALIGSSGADTLTGGAHHDILTGNNGDDILNAGAGNDTLNGGAGLDTLNGGDGTDTLNGGADADTLDGGTGGDSMSGGAGDDTYYVDSGSDTTNELLNEGTDLVISSSTFIGLNANIENLTLVGSATSSAFGNASNNVMTGSTGVNTLSGAGGVDSLYGGDGNDILYAWSGTNFSGNGALVDPTFMAGEVFDGGAGTDTLYMREDWTFDLSNVTLNSIEALWVMSSATVNIDADDLGAGLATNLTVTSNTSDIRINIIRNTAGATSVAGWTLNAFNAGDQIALIGSSGADTLTGGAHLDILNGNDGDDILNAGAGNDTVTGGAGADTIDGGTGVDSMSGGTGDDTYYVDSNSDVVTELDGQGSDTVVTGLVYSLAGTFIENLTLVGGDLNGTGSTFNNIITGTAGNNLLIGGGGVDQLLGGDGNDTLQISGAVSALDNVVISGGAGTDTLSFGSPSTLYDLRGSTISSIERVTLVSDGEVHLSSSGLSSTMEVFDGVVFGVFAVHLAAPGTLDASGWTFTGWSYEIDPNLYGTSGADTIIGTSVDDNTYAGDGNDIVNSGAGPDKIWGEGGDDTITGGSGDDTIDGGAGNDSIIGGADADTINGGDGADSIDGGSGIDAMSGGDGDDSYVVDNASDTVSESSNQGTDTVQSSVSFTIDANIENLTLTGIGSIDGAGNSLNNVITGNAGNNLLAGGGGVDQLLGGDGDDTLQLSGAVTALQVAVLSGGAGTDTLGFGGAFTVYDLRGSSISSIERLALGFDAEVHFNVGGGLPSTLEVADGNGSGILALHLTAPGAIDISGWTFTGWSFGIDPDLYGTSGADTITGASVDDNTYAGDGNDVVNSGAGSDEIWGEGGVDTIDGGSGDDFIYGGLSNDSLSGGADADTIDGGDGADTMAGGDGNDTYVVDNAGDVTSETSALGGTDTVQSSLTRTLGANLENLVLTGAAAINGFGNALNNSITGNGAANQLNGFDGADILNGGLGADSMFGGNGDDTYYIDNAGDQATEVSALGGTDTVISSVARNLTANIENLTLTGSANIIGSGNSINNIIIGNAGVNTLYGFDGNDRLDGGLGADTLFGANGDDTYVVDDVGDITVEGSTTGGIDTVETYISRNMNANFENMILLGSATIAYGNVLGNVLTGNALANALYGFDGNDTLNGGAGADQMFGANGDDTYIVDNAGDVTSEVSALGGIDTVISSVERNLTANLENLVLSGVANINGAGNGLNNVITGNGGVNTLFGLGGDDTLDGGLGADTLQGGAGADSYVFSTALGGGNVDAIVGFSVADDTIVLSNAVFTGLSAGALAASAFTIGAAAADADDRIVYNSATGQLYFDADGNGVGAAVLFATLAPGLALTSADFIVGGP